MADSVLNIKSLLSLVALVLSVAACGVRGKPQPPLTPPELGRGRPTFQRATPDLAFPNVPPVETVPNPEPQPGVSPEESQ